MACLISVTPGPSYLNSELLERRNSKFLPFKSLVLGWGSCGDGGLFDYSFTPGPSFSVAVAISQLLMYVR